MNDIIVSGIQPTGSIHLGNYFGAIQQQLKLQEEFPNQCYFFIADYHALTSLHDKDKLKQNIFEIAVTYLSLGLDPQKSFLFRQSDIPEVTELSWLLATVTGMGLLERAHSYKDKISNGIKPNVGLFYYPILMAADILIYGGTKVPVGKDQLQHIEIAQDIATHFNESFKTTILNRPEPFLSSSPYVIGIDGRKMSKSYDNTLPLFLEGKALQKEVMKIVTDSTPFGNPLKLETTYSLLQLFCNGEELEQIRGYYETGKKENQFFGWGSAKLLLCEKIESHFQIARKRREYYLSHPQEVESILKESAGKVREVARSKIRECREVVGL